MIKLKDLNRDQKILLFKEIAVGNVNREGLTDDTLIGIEPSNAFLGLLMAASAYESDEGDLNIVCIGEARIEQEKLSELSRK
jgi:hypothetical protein